jgi:hypothetical protein
LAIYGLTALTADHVVMVPFIGMVIDGLVPGFTLEHTFIFFEKFQGAVDSRFIDMGKLLMNMVDNFLSCEMVAFVMDKV